MWEVEYTEQFGDWWDTLTPAEQTNIDGYVQQLQERGPGLGRPAVDTITTSRHGNMKELRVGTIRVLFCFDPRRTAILLIGGDKRGRYKDFYDELVQIADALYDEHLEELRKEGPTPDA